MSAGRTQPPPSPRYLAGKSVGVVGLGQIGGSIVRRLAAWRPEIRIYGTDADRSLAPRVRRYCRWRDALEDVVRASDLLVLAVPVPRIIALLPDVAAVLRRCPRPSRLVVTDTGTIKLPVVTAARKYRKAFDFVGMHPLSGGEKNGWPSARAGLFVGDKIVCCASGQARPVRLTLELIRLLGGVPVRIDSRRHDRLIATTIGLPHMLAFAAQGLPSRSQAVRKLHGRSWGTLTRVASSDPAMVGGFLHANRSEQIRAVRELQRRLDELVRAMQEPTGAKVESLLKRWRRRPSQ